MVDAYRPIFGDVTAVGDTITRRVVVGFERIEAEEQCCICRQPKPVSEGGNISTGNIEDPTYKFCCNTCFHGMACR